MSTATGTQSDARFETTAAWAEAEASDVKLAAEVEQNAHQLHDAAQAAAQEAQFKTPSESAASAVNNLEAGLSQTTDKAVTEGQENVQGYVAQAKNLANSAVNTAASYIPTTTTTTDSTATNTGSTAASLQATAVSAAQTTKEYLVQAQAIAAPVATQALNAGLAAVETARTTAAPYVQSATDAVTRAVSGTSADTTTPTTHVNGVAPKSAPLESGPHVVESPYAAAPHPKVADV
ncbi:hypothetical protein BXZ70DRAFT_1009071 [Cristinia sonorae]|uniref:Uncharacterized protein n=1 Tax=Cristinia sonorae TaxID=1940300 RepID=A0A8K0XNK1_9AGAR|nr:hypothetical protein BXZ70DRAFT_1009071 [Cristinia sonorae]